jgi:predicted nucleic acid-binding protein
VIRKIFLDTNIVLDLLDDQRPRHTDAKQVLTRLIEADTEIFISEDMVSTLFYIIKNKALALEFFETVCEEWRVVPFGLDVVREAVAACRQNPSLDLEDALQCLCAKANGCELLLTEDKGFEPCGVDVAGYETLLASA